MNEVERFIDGHSQLESVLAEAVPVIQDIFGDGTPLGYEMFNECCSQQLFVRIGTPLSADEAMPLLDRFDKEWWFGIQSDVHKDLEFTLEFL